MARRYFVSLARSRKESSSQLEVLGLIITEDASRTIPKSRQCSGRVVGMGILLWFLPRIECFALTQATGSESLAIDPFQFWRGENSWAAGQNAVV